ncbi:hypothetical protein BGZ68_009068 [Mortierella alpina]|nr:hypothetical protein BGZ68_009068 [Mortierella alpina]
MSSLSLSPPHEGEGHPQDPKQDQNQDQHQGRENISKTSLFVFARAQPQYLFAESAKNIGKRVLDDRGLVRWWKNMITSAYSTPSSPSSSSPSLPSSSSVPSKIQGWWLIPGIETERQATNVIQSKSTLQTPATTSTSTSTAGTPVLLQYGYSDKDSTAMAHTLIPQFPDDPKSRMMKSPSCQGGFVDIKTFWELAAIGEESGAGKITGFFKVVEEVKTPAECLSSESKTKTGSSASTTTTAAAAAAAATTSTACLTGSTGDYTRAINFLLELNFSTLDRAQESTQQWLDRLEVWTKKATLKNAEAIVGATSFDVEKNAPLQTKSDEVQLQETNDLKTDTTTAPSPMDHRSSRASPLWIQQGTVRIQLLQAHNSSVGQTSAASGSIPADADANLIKRKPQQQQQQQAHSLSTLSDATTAFPQVNVLGGNLIKRKPIAGGTETPAVNVLGGNLIKRKPATTLATSTPTTTTTSTTTEAAVTSATPVPSSDSSTPSEPTVNILGSNFIKKRKLDP